MAGAAMGAVMGGVIAAVVMGILILLLSFLVFTLFLHAGAYLIFYLAIVLNRALWPLIRGIVRALYEHEIVKKKKLLFFVGLLLLYVTFFPKLNIEGIWKVVEKLL